MKPGFVRTSVDLPRDLHQRLLEAAAQQGCTARELILKSIERTVDESRPRRVQRRLKPNPPIVPSTGKPFTLTNAEIYELIEFP